MTTPSRRLSTAPLASTGPSRSILQKLLEEIDGTIPEAKRILKSPLRTPSIRSPGRKNSIWVRGGPMAEEAREKLRAADQDRQRRRSSVIQETLDTEPPQQLRRRSTQTGAQLEPLQSATLIDTAPTYNDFSFLRQRSTTSAQAAAPVSPGGSDSSSINESRHSPRHSPGPGPKRPCYDSPHEHDLWIRCDGHPESGPSSTMVSRTATFTERESLGDIIESSSINLARTPTLSSFRPTAATPPGHYETPTRESQEPVSSSFPLSPDTLTPAWVKPFHLVDDDKSVFKNIHGEDWNEHALCLHCFRCHGSFQRILQEGCEVCGREDVLKGHYWEQVVDSY